MYGHRARIGYISPLLVTEVFIHEFYQIVPPGVTLALSGLTFAQGTGQEVQESFDLTLRAARVMGAAGVNLVVLGGTFLNVFKGFDKLDEVIKTTQEACGVPVTTSLSARKEAFQRVKARRIAVVDLFGDGRQEGESRQQSDYVERLGYEVVGRKGVGLKAYANIAQLPSEASMQAARDLLREHPEADTVYFPGAHRATVDQIEALEQQLRVNVVGASQSIIWHALRRCGIHDAIPGYGRLLREP
jgi:maleate cis-trans isomerase